MSPFPSPDLFPSGILYPESVLAGPVGPPMSQMSADVYDQLSPIADGDADRGYPLATLIGGLGEMFLDIEQLARAQPGREPYQQAFDINAAPTFLYPWLGQVVGVRDINGLSPSAQKTAIIAESQFYRGSVGAMQTKVAQTLTGNQTVRLIERTSDAWTLSVITNASETPNPPLTARAAESAKVAMNVLTVVTSDLPIVDEGTARTIDAATGIIDTARLSDIT